MHFIFKICQTVGEHKYNQSISRFFLASRRLLRGGRSLVTLNPGQQGHPTHQQPTMRESRSYAALVSPTHLQRIMLRDSSSSDSD